MNVSPDGGDINEPIIEWRTDFDSEVRNAVIVQVLASRQERQ